MTDTLTVTERAALLNIHRQDPARPTSILVRECRALAARGYLHRSEGPEYFQTSTGQWSSEIVERFEIAMPGAFVVRELLHGKESPR